VLAVPADGEACATATNPSAITKTKGPIILKWRKGEREEVGRAGGRGGGGLVMMMKKGLLLLEPQTFLGVRWDGSRFNPLTPQLRKTHNLTRAGFG
jgi:hypothetical protein